VNEADFEDLAGRYESASQAYRDAQRYYREAQRAAESGDWEKAGAYWEQARGRYNEGTAILNQARRDQANISRSEPPDARQQAELKRKFDEAQAEGQRAGEIAQLPDAGPGERKRGRDAAQQQRRKRRTAVGLGLGGLVVLGGAALLLYLPPGSGIAPAIQVLPFVPGAGGLSWGDTHLVTFDGVQVDFQAAGEFVLIRSESGDLEVQVRQQPAHGSKTVSLNTAAAANIAGDHVSIDGAQDEPLRINGETSTVSSEGVDLPNGGHVAFDGVFYMLTWPDGSAITVPVWNYEPRWLDVRVALADTRAGTVEGLLGDSDGDPANDLTTADGKALRTDDVSFEDLYRMWGDSWRLKASDSLFDYTNGQSTESFTDREFPDEVVTFDSLDAGERAEATRVCREAGVTQAVLLRACVLDVAVTGSHAFAAAAAQTLSASNPSGQGSRASLTVTGARDETFELTLSSGSSGSAYVLLTYSNAAGQRLEVYTYPPRTGAFKTGEGASVRLQAFPGATGYSHSADSSDECTVTLTKVTMAEVDGALRCSWEDLEMHGTFAAQGLLND
jgi:hypothetical protein